MINQAKPVSNKLFTAINHNFYMNHGMPWHIFHPLPAASAPGAALRILLVPYQVGTPTFAFAQPRAASRVDHGMP